MATTTRGLSGLVDFLHVVTVPVVLGSGVALWEGLDGLAEAYTIESFTSASGLAHQLWNRG